MIYDAESLFTALRIAGLPPIPDEFSVVPWYQQIPHSTLLEIDHFIRVFEDVTTRAAWQKSVTAVAAPIARRTRTEICFFSAWDFHVPADQTQWKLIEFNDNGSGFLFASLINDVFYGLSGLEQDAALQRGTSHASLCAHILSVVEIEISNFFGTHPQGLFLILDDADSLQAGKFRRELDLLRTLFRSRGWETEIGAPDELAWSGQQLRWQGRNVCVVVNRSTDFLWDEGHFRSLRSAYRNGHVYVAPNPFTYSTRSDKQLLECLSLPIRDEELGIRDNERAVLSAHVPETLLVREDNLEELARRKHEFVFKPARGFAARGLLQGSEVGRTRLRRLLKQHKEYVAQKKIPKPRLHAPTDKARPLWTDLRVWAYRGERYLISGRASCDAEKLVLTPPGGWIPTYMSAKT